MNGGRETMISLLLSVLVFAATEVAPSSRPESSRPDLEQNAPADWFRHARGPFVTQRGLLAEALRKADVRAVFIGSIEGERSYIGKSARAHSAVLTECTIRIHAVFKDLDEDLAIGRLVRVTYHGGRLADGRVVYPSDEPKCFPFDYGVFSLYYSGGALLPVPQATFSMLGSGSEWPAHPLTKMLSELAPILLPLNKEVPHAKRR